MGANVDGTSKNFGLKIPSGYGNNDKTLLGSHLREWWKISHIAAFAP